MAELNFNASHFTPMQPAEELSDYAGWMELCRRMDREAADARLEWRAAVAERDRINRQLKDRVEELRQQCKDLENRPKPPSPKRT